MASVTLWNAGVTINVDMVQAMPRFPCSLFLPSTFPRPRHAFGDFVGCSFGRSRFFDESEGTNCDGEVFAWMGMGTSYILSFWKIPGVDV